MKKFVSVLLCIAMLLTVCAFAEGGELTISNVVVSLGEEALDFSGIDLRLAAAAGETDGGLRIALGANGEVVLSGLAVLNEQGVALAMDGLSNTYTISMADLMAMMAEDPDFQQMMQLMQALDFTEQDLVELVAIFETFMANVQASISDTGTEEINGETYQTYAVNFGEEGYDALFGGLAALLDKHPALVGMIMDGTGYSTLSEAYEASGMKLRAEGVAISGESEVEVDLMGYGSAEGMEEIAMNCYVYAAAGADEETGTEAVDMSIALSEVVDEEYVGIVELNGCITSVTATGELAAFDGYIAVPAGTVDGEEAYEGVLFGLYGPALTGTGLWQISIGDWNETVSFDVSFGNADGMDGVYGMLTAEEAQISFYTETVDGVGTAGVAFADAESLVEVTADIALSETDGTWTAVDTSNAVDILTITEEQVNTVSMEAMIALMGAVSELAAANDTVAMLAGNLMG